MILLWTHSQKVPFSTIVTTYQNLKRKCSFKTPFFLVLHFARIIKRYFQHHIVHVCLEAQNKKKTQFFFWIFVTFLGGDFVCFQNKLVIGLILQEK